MKCGPTVLLIGAIVAFSQLAYASAVTSAVEDTESSLEIASEAVARFPYCPKLTLSLGEVAYIKGPGKYGKSRNCKTVYCGLECLNGSTPKPIGEDAVRCCASEPKPMCVGTLSLSPGQSADKVKGGFSYGYKTYCHVQCKYGATLVHKGGKAACVPKPVCDGTLQLSPGQSVQKVRGGFLYAYNGKTYCHVQCKYGATLVHKDGKATCVPKPVKPVYYGGDSTDYSTTMGTDYADDDDSGDYSADDSDDYSNNDSDDYSNDDDDSNDYSDDDDDSSDYSDDGDDASDYSDSDSDDYSTDYSGTMDDDDSGDYVFDYSDGSWYDY